MLFKQLFDQETCTYTYLIADTLVKEAVLIDPVNTHVEEYIALLQEYSLQLKYSLETHVHADHITAGGLLRQRLGSATAVSQLCGADCADIQIENGHLFEFGQSETIRVIATPGHTVGSISFLWRDKVFTGDSLLIDGCGRTDFQGGDAGTLYDCITQHLFSLPDETLVYPGHDYNGRWVSSIIQERNSNARLAGKSREQFIDIMNHLNLPKPRLIDAAIPANRYCGLDVKERHDTIINREIHYPVHAITTTQAMVAEAKQHITEISVPDAKRLIADGGLVLVDTREESEYAAGHLDNALLVPRGVLEFKIGNLPELSDKNKTVLLYCRSGNRSALAAKVMQQLGYNKVLSMIGGYEAWCQSN